MANLTYQSNMAGAIAARQSFGTLNRYPNKSISKSVIQIYYIDQATIIDGLAHVDYTLNDEWLTAAIEFSTIKAYVIKTGMNDYRFDTADSSGCHVQDCGSFEVDTYISENLNEAVRGYLEAIKAGQYNIN